MSNETATKLMDRLDDLLDDERAVLLTGNLEGIARIATMKQRLIDALRDIDPSDVYGLDLIQAKLERNRLLIDGALQGIRNVASRLAVLRKIRRSMETYDAQGRKQLIEGDATHRIEKRA